MTPRPFPELASADNSRSASPALSAGKTRGPGKAAGRLRPGAAQAGGDSGAGRKAGGRSKPRKPRAPASSTAEDRAEDKAENRTEGKAEDNAKGKAAPKKNPRRRGGRKGKKKAERNEGPPAVSAPASAPMSAPASAPLPAIPVRSLSNGMLWRATVVAGENGRARVLLGDEEQQPIPGMSSGPRFVSSHVLQQRRSTTAHQAGRYGDALGLSAAPPPTLRQRSLTGTQRAGAAPQLRRLASDDGRGRSYSSSHAGGVLAPAARTDHGYFATRRASESAGLAVNPDQSIHIPEILFQQRHASFAGAPATPSDEDGEAVAMRRLQDMIAAMKALGRDRAPAQPPALPTPAHPSARFDSILEEDEDSDASLEFDSAPAAVSLCALK
ncbi:hypothetical protein IWW55_006086 [Coemansia sp. RSA 2706]|nr:hypothetical protein IWW55_006086 [Coemansia sp. RSA 2706]